MFVVESSEVIELGDFFEVLSQFIELPVLLSVQVGLHEGSDLTHTHTHAHKIRFSVHYADNNEGQSNEDNAGRPPSVRSVGS